MRVVGLLPVLAAIVAAATVHAQPAAGEPDLRALCAGVPAAPTEARALAVRAHCVLLGLIPSAHPFADARESARRSLQQGDAVGGYLLYMAFVRDPQNMYLRDGKVDMAAYQRLAARPLDQRGEQVEAIDALAFSAAKGHVQAAVALATYFHETTAPYSIQRLGDLAAWLVRNNQRTPPVPEFARQASAVYQLAPATKASALAFRDALQGASSAAAAAGRTMTGTACAAPRLKSVRSGDIDNALYLPLTQPGVRESYLLRGTWTEQWTFAACEQDVPVRVRFTADGWGGAYFQAMQEKAP